MSPMNNVGLSESPLALPECTRDSMTVKSGAERSLFLESLGFQIVISGHVVISILTYGEFLPINVKSNVS